MLPKYVQEKIAGNLELDNIELADVIDAIELQEMMDNYHAITGIGIGIIDLKGKVLVGTGWQDICVKFHRAQPESCSYCHESDISLSSGVAPGTFKAYRCKNNMWDIATPIMLQDRHIGNIFLGQFLYDDEEPDYELFRAQALRFGYDQNEYIAALERVPRYSRDTVQTAMSFYSKLARMISKTNYNNVILAKTLLEQEKAEKALRENEEKFRTLFECMAEGVALHEMIYDYSGTAVDYRIIDINPSYTRHTGINQSEVIGTLASRLYGASTPPYLSEFGEVAGSGVPQYFETYFPPLKKHFSISVVSSKPGQFATVFEDITDRIEKEKELQDKNAELERFAYTVSHDLKSPLTTIKGFTGAIEQDLIDDRYDRMKGDLSRISTAVDRMSDLLNDLLRLSTIGHVVNPSDPVNMNRLADDVIEQLAGSLRTSNIRIEQQPNLPEVFCDRRRMSEVLQNLFENAVKYVGDQTDPKILFGANEEDGEVVFFVKDNGIGIDQKYHQKIFGLFNKLDAKSGGTGVGLALVKRIIEVHGGRVWVESDGEGKGSKFCFTVGGV